MMLLIKQTLIALLYYSGILSLRNWLLTLSGSAHSACVLMYHRVLPDPEARTEYAQTGIAVSAAAFEKQVAFLSKHYNLMTAGDLVERLRTGQKLPKNCAVITFDDGWRDNVEIAYPILKRYSAPATIFVCTDFVGSTSKFWFHEILHAILWQELTLEQLQAALDRAAEGGARPERIPTTLTGVFLIDHYMRLVKNLSAEQVDVLCRELVRASGRVDDDWRRRRFVMDWQEIRAMEEAFIEIGSHGCSHRLLTSIPVEEARREMQDSRRVLEENTGRKVRTFAYPNGAYDETIRGIAAEAGYLGAFAVGGGSGLVDLFALPRVGVHEGATAGIGGRFSRAKFALMLNRASKLQIDAPVTAAK